MHTAQLFLSHGTGFGDPDSSISAAKQRASGELSEEVELFARDLIESNECLVDVVHKDDGCIDGRFAYIKLHVGKSGEVEKSIINTMINERAKVAGGGYFTGLSMRTALGMHGGTVDEDLAEIVEHYATQGLYCGGHRGEHMHGDKTDCGANDKLDVILHNAIKYETEITKAIEAILVSLGTTLESDALKNVFKNWRKLAHTDTYFADSSGSKRFNTILRELVRIEKHRKDGDDRPLSVLKDLFGNHKEDFIILNFVDGKTFSQRLFRQKLRETFPFIPDNLLAQVFVVDVWRIKQLADGLADGSDEQLQAFYAGVAYQLATAATLTDGTLPVYTITPATVTATN